MSLHSSLDVVAGSSADCSVDGALSAPSKSTTTANGYLCSARMTDCLSRSQSGRTSEPSTGDLGLDGWISSLAASPARTSAQPEEAPELRESKAASGPRWPASFARYDPATASWKTPQCSLFGGWAEFSGTWPRWGSMRNGACLELPTWAPLTSASGSGFWPTPTVQDANGRDRHNQRDGSVTLSLLGQARMWPTPTASMVTVQDQEQARFAGSDPRRPRYATVLASDGKRGRRGRNSVTRGGGECLPGQVGGPLNPTWVEWLMNFPLGWTSLEPLTNELFQDWKYRTESGTTDVSDCGGGPLRPLWWEEDPSETPYRPQSNEQRARQHCPVVRGLPWPGAQDSPASTLRDMRNGVPAETVEAQGSRALPEPSVPEREGQTIGRVAMGVQNRVARLKALGNAQVPAVAALAWRILGD